MKDAANLTIVENELLRRKNEIREAIVNLFEKNMQITDLDIPEPNDNEAAKILIEIFIEKINELKQDVVDGKYNNF